MGRRETGFARTHFSIGDITEFTGEGYSIFDSPTLNNNSRAFYTQWTFELLEFMHRTDRADYVWEDESVYHWSPSGLRSG